MTWVKWFLDLLSVIKSELLLRLKEFSAQTRFTREYRAMLIAVKGTRLAGEPVREIFLAVDYAARPLCLPKDCQSRALYAITQMIWSSCVPVELLRSQLSESLPGSFQLAAQALNLTAKQLTDKLVAGEILAEDFLPAFAKTLREEFYTEWVRMHGFA